MASPLKKLKTDARKPCPYGSVCYRKNPVHFQDFSHPGDKDHDPKSATTDDGVVASTSGVGLPVAGFGTGSIADSSHLPPCKYGINCFRKNLLHFAEYSHPVGTAASSSADGDGNDGSDTDVYDSDEDGKKTKTGKEKKPSGEDILKRGMSLVKRFSQMTDAERKELIQKAFAAKEALQKELNATKKVMDEKDKQLDSLSEQLRTGTLLVDGEKEAVEGKDTVYFTLVPERQYREGSAAQIHYRLAESQFYRLLSGPTASGYRVKKVDYVVTPHLVKRFREAQYMLKKTRGEEWSAPVLGFHGTQESNIESICQNGFKVPGEDGFTHRCDSGYYGAGVYFSEYPAYSMGYISGGQKLLLCQVLPGKTYQCTKLIMGAKRQDGYDSHMSPNKKELVIFHSRRILPCYVVYFSPCNGVDFTYTKAKVSKHRRKAPVGPGAPVFSKGTVHTKRIFANNAPLTKALEGKAFRFAGPAADSKNLFQLIAQHKGKKGTGVKYDVLVAVPGVSEDNKLVEKALEKDLPIVTEDFIYECIVHKKYLDPAYFLHAMYDL
ncbi:hypothetical protein ACOMHN_041706 [Nucella lapillus]